MGAAPRVHRPDCTKRPFIFANPISGSNEVDWRWIDMPEKRFNGTITFIARSDGNPWLENSVQPGGSPVEAVYTLAGHRP